MKSQDFHSIVKPKVHNETIIELSKIKSFIDASIKECFTKDFENEKQKTVYLLDTLYNMRDFVISQTIENSLRQNLIEQFNKIEAEVLSQEKLGNETQQEKMSGQTLER